MRIRRTTISARASACGFTDEDYAAIGEQLEVDYEALPRKFSVDAQGRVTFEAHARSDASGAFPSAGAEQCHT